MNTRILKKINQDFFKKWSSNMAYVLGFVVADGCICKRKERKESYIFNITSKDKDILLKIRRSLGSDHPIGIKYNSQKMPCSQIQISNRENGTPQIKVGFVSTSLSFLTEFNKQLCRNLRIPLKSIHKTIDQKRKRMTQFNTHFYIDDCERLYKFMYKKASIFLDRKYRIFKKWENIKSENRRHYIKQNYPSKIGWQLNQKVFAGKIV